MRSRVNYKTPTFTCGLTPRPSISYARSDFTYGKLVRSLRLPDTADADNVEAQMQDGVLTVKLKRAEHAQPKTIDIQ